MKMKAIEEMNCRKDEIILRLDELQEDGEACELPPSGRIGPTLKEILKMLEVISSVMKTRKFDMPEPELLEVRGWLDEAVGYVHELSNYFDRRDRRLDEEAATLTDELLALASDEQSQSEINQEEGVWLDRQKG